MAKKHFYKIGDACKQLGIQPYVLRYWETEFPALTPDKSRSGQRVYGEREMGIIRRIKHLLYEEGYTIAGAKKKLEAELANGGAVDGDSPTSGSKPTPAKTSKAASSKAKTTTTKAKTSAKRSTKTPAKPSSTKTAKSAVPAGDTAEHSNHLRQGLETALQQTRQILDLLATR